MAATCPSCGLAFEPAVRIRGGRCERCRASGALVDVGDRFGRLQFRLSPFVIEVERVPPQPAAVTAGTLVVLGWTLFFSAFFQLMAWHLRFADRSKLLLATVLLGGVQGIIAAMKWLPLASPHALVARRSQLELGRWGRRGWKVVRAVPAARIQRFGVRETASGFGVTAQLVDGREVLLAGDLTEADDAKRLATALRELLQISADEPLQVGARTLPPERVDAPRELRRETLARGVRLQLPGLQALKIEADVDGIRVQRRFARALALDVDDVQALEAEIFVARPGGAPRYRVIARLRRGRAVLAADLASAQLAQYLRGELARALGVEKD